MKRQALPNVKRWAITIPTHDNDPEYRVLAFANQGRNHYDTKEQGEQALQQLLTNNSPERLKQSGLDGARADEVECYHHGDAVGIYIRVCDDTR